MKDGDYYMGFVTEIPAIVTQSKSMDEMKENMKFYIKSWMKRQSESIDQEDPFEIREIEVPKIIKMRNNGNG